MNETKGNARTKPRRKPKSAGIPENFERGPLKEREMNSLSDSEKTNKIKINNNQEKSKIKIAKFAVHEAEIICKSLNGFEKLGDNEKAIAIIFASVSILNKIFK